MRTSLIDGIERPCGALISNYLLRFIISRFGLSISLIYDPRLHLHFLFNHIYSLFSIFSIKTSIHAIVSFLSTLCCRVVRKSLNQVNLVCFSISDFKNGVSSQQKKKRKTKFSGEFSNLQISSCLIKCPYFLYR